jgi:hypothetical protein
LAQRGRTVLLAALLSGCAGARATLSPEQVLRDYSAALEAGKAEEAYVLLSAEAKKSIPFEYFRRMLKENPEEVRELAKSLARPTASPPRVTATVHAPDGQSLLLVYERGQWRVDGSAVDLYSQSSPEAAVRAFVRAFNNRRYDVLLRFVPDEQRQGLTEAQLKAAWEGEQRVELERLTAALNSALPTARFELLGDRATMAYGAGGTVELVREQGVWKIEELK